MIIKDRKELAVKWSPVAVKEGEEIGVRLLHELRQSKNGIGLAANQIGIDKRVCVINVKEPLVLINPKIVEKSKEQFNNQIQQLEDQFSTIQSQIDELGASDEEVISKVKSFANWKN